MNIGFEILNIRIFMLLFYKPMCVFCVCIRLFKQLLCVKRLFEWVPVMQISVQMTIHILMGFSSCTSLYDDYPFLCVCVFVMHITVRMTIHILMGFCQAHLVANDYPYYLFMCFRHGHFCTNDYPYSCMVFCHVHLCMNDYFVPNFFPMHFC